MPEPLSREGDRDIGDIGPPIVYHRPGEIHVYQLTGEHLEQLAESGLSRSVNTLLASTLFGALLTIVVWRLTGDFSNSNADVASIAGLTIIGVLFVFFGIGAIRDYKRSRRLIRRAKGDED